MTTVQQPVSDDDDDEVADEQEQPAAAAASEPKITYGDKVVAMFLSISAHWQFTHSVNHRDAREILHDVAYGMQKLFLILGKPYLGATEGNEAAHQEMKKDFHMMCSHSSKRAGSMLQLMRLHHLKPSKRAKKDSDASIPAANEHLKAQSSQPAATNILVLRRRAARYAAPLGDSGHH